MKGPHDLHGPAQIYALFNDILEASLSLCLGHIQHECVPDIVHIIHAGQLRNASPAHHGEQVDYEVGISAQDHECPTAEAPVVLKRLAILHDKGGKVNTPLYTTSGRQVSYLSTHCIHKVWSKHKRSPLLFESLPRENQYDACIFTLKTLYHIVFDVA